MPCQASADIADGAYFVCCVIRNGLTYPVTMNYCFVWQERPFEKSVIFNHNLINFGVLFLGLM